MNILSSTALTISTLLHTSEKSHSQRTKWVPCVHLWAHSLSATSLLAPQKPLKSDHSLQSSTLSWMALSLRLHWHDGPFICRGLIRVLDWQEVEFLFESHFWRHDLQFRNSRYKSLTYKSLALIVFVRGWLSDSAVFWPAPLLRASLKHLWSPWRSSSTWNQADSESSVFVVIASCTRVTRYNMSYF